MQTTFNTFNVIFIARSARSKVETALPIYCRITVNGKPAEFSIQRSVDSENWENGKPKGRGEEIRSLNHYLKEVEGGIFEHYRAFIANKKVVTADALKRAYLGVVDDQYSLLSLIDYHNTQLKSAIEWGTMKNYMTTQRYVQEFLKVKFKVSDIFLRNLTYKFITDFEYFLRSHIPVDYHKKMGNNTVMKHIERLRKMINLAVKNEWLERDPFSKFQARFIRNDREFLTEDELSRIEYKDFKIPRLDWARDLFVFSCYTGLAYCDLMKLTPQQIGLGIDGEYWIMTSRKKTNTPVRVPLLPKAWALVNKYRNHVRASVSGTVFPSLSNQKVNAYLKEIAFFCSIEKNLTFHLARHTFATTITLTNGVPIETHPQEQGSQNLSFFFQRCLEKGQLGSIGVGHLNQMS